MTHPQFDCDLIAKQKEQELALCRQLLEAQGETIKQQAAVIEQMRGAIGAWERADGNEELQEAEAKLIAAMNAPANLDALHEAMDKEREECAAICDRFYERGMNPAECAGAIRARKENSHE